MKLLYILKEGLHESKPITLDKEVFSQIKELYDELKGMIRSDGKYIVSLLSKGRRLKLGRVKYTSPYDPSFTGVDVYLVYVTGPGGAKEAVAVYNKHDKIILLNLHEKELFNRGYFEDVLYHELVHAIDPKQYIQQKDSNKDSSDEYFKYIKRPHELDAYSSSFVNNLSNNIDGLASEEDKDQAKLIIRNLINKLISIQKDTPPTGYPESDKDFTDKRYAVLDILRPLMSLKTNSGKSVLRSMVADTFVDNMLFYMHKPTMFKKYIQRLSTIL